MSKLNMRWLRYDVPRGKRGKEINPFFFFFVIKFDELRF